ncbi:MAG TPA: response regulator, partial [Myxococcota bacterium]|nr:response regulator [Myxococcota bacterium]
MPLAGRRIVVADDDPAVRWFIAGLLGAVGCEVIEAQDGLQARDLVFSAWPDALVTDVLMPGLDGFSLCAAVKRDVAMRDAPVMLLSWKEDLLQRIRELGSDADAYLRKEAPASVFVERLREVLRPRARIEARLDTGGEVRGRLDGLTPRLVLELVCRRRLDASVSFNDAAYVYEVEIRDGLVRAATRTAADGSFARGEPVLSGLLGVFAGRFTVTPDRSPCRGLVTGALESVLAEPIARARAAQLALEPGRLALIERIELDLTNISGYLPALPPAAGSLVQGLIEGRPPRELMWSAGGFVERLLDDLARRGAVCAVWGRDAADLLAAARAELEPHPAEPEPKASAFSFEVDAAAEPLEEVASELAGEPLPPRASAPVAAVEPQSEAPKVEAKDESKPTAEQEPEPPALEAEAATPPPKPAPPLKPAPPAKPPTKPQLDAEARVSIPPELDSAVVRLVDKGWDEAPGGPPEFGRAEPRKLEGVDTMPAALQRAPA